MNRITLLNLTERNCKQPTPLHPNPYALWCIIVVICPLGFNQERSTLVEFDRVPRYSPTPTPKSIYTLSHSQSPIPLTITSPHFTLCQESSHLTNPLIPRILTSFLTVKSHLIFHSSSPHIQCQKAPNPPLKKFTIHLNILSNHHPNQHQKLTKITPSKANFPPNPIHIPPPIIIHILYNILYKNLYIQPSPYTPIYPPNSIPTLKIPQIYSIFSNLL